MNNQSICDFSSGSLSYSSMGETRKLDMSVNNINTYSVEANLCFNGKEIMNDVHIITSMDFDNQCRNQTNISSKVIGPEVMDFINKNDSLKSNIFEIIKDIFIISSKKDNMLKITANVNKSEDKIEIRVYLLKSSTGFLIDLNDELANEIFEEAQKISDFTERTKLLNLFSVSLFDTQNGVKL